MIFDRNTFRKYERLTLKREIDALFTPGSKSFAAYPLRAVCRMGDYGRAEVKVLVSVSKRHFHDAADRNRAKRQIREAYRLNKNILASVVKEKNDASPENRHSLNVAFIWLSDNPQDSELVAKKLKNLLHRIAESLPESFAEAQEYCEED